MARLLIKRLGERNSKSKLYQEQSGIMGGKILQIKIKKLLIPRFSESSCLALFGELGSELANPNSNKMVMTIKNSQKYM